MLNKCLHLISIKESTPGGGAKARPGKTPASDELLLSFPLGKMGPLAYGDRLSEDCPHEQYILESSLENTLQQIKGHFPRDKTWALDH